MFEFLRNSFYTLLITLKSVSKFGDIYYYASESFEYENTYIVMAFFYLYRLFTFPVEVLWMRTVKPVYSFIPSSGDPRIIQPLGKPSASSHVSVNVLL